MAADGRALPRVGLAVGRGQGDGEEEELGAVLEHVVWLGGECEGMGKAAFVELCEMMVPTWDRADV